MIKEKSYNINFTSKPVLLAHQIAEVLSEAIMEGRISGGEKLVEMKLQEELGVSRTPLREAFRELEKRGLVIIVPRRGAFVRVLSQKDIDDNFPVRAALEGLAARLACTRVTKEDIEELSNVLAGMDIAAKSDNAKVYLENHIQYHEIYINASGNDIIINTLRTLRMHTIWHRFYFKYHTDDYDKSLAIHHKILKLFSNRKSDPFLVEEVVKEHIMAGYQRFIDYLKEQQN